MGAGATKQQIANGKRRILYQARQELIEAGLGEHSNLLSVRVIRASNGETAGLLEVSGTYTPGPIVERVQQYLSGIKRRENATREV